VSRGEIVEGDTDDADPNVSVSNASVTEGDSGTALETFTVTLDAPSGQEAFVDYTTSDATALAGVDYTAATGTVSIPAGSTQATFDVAVLGDLLYEGSETFTVMLSGEVNLTIADGTGVGTITDDDPVPTLSASAGTATERNSGSTAATITFALSNPSATVVAFDWATADGTATAGADYTAGSGSATILAGATEVTADVQILGDTTDEPDETLSITLADVTGAVAGSGATLTIADDDKTPTTLTAKVSKTTTAVKVKGVLEPATSGLTVTVTLFRRKGTKYVKVTAKTVGAKGLKDRDGDGLLDGAYLAKLPRPSKGSYKVTVVFNGNATLAGSSATVTFTL
jgi:chitinase